MSVPVVVDGPAELQDGFMSRAVSAQAWNVRADCVTST